MVAVSVALLIISFPVRAFWNEIVGNILGLTGVILLIKYVVRKAAARIERENV